MLIKLTKYLGMALIMLLMATAVLVFFAPHFGWRVDTVSSGSMEPALKVGGVVVTQPAQAETIRVGDTITFHSPLNNELTSHRVVAADKGSSLNFQTKGDANEDADPYILPAANLVGKVCFHLPYFGYVAQFIKTPLGLVLTLCLPGLVIIVIEMVKIWRVLTEKEIDGKYRVR
jgi:signal peptidase